MRSTRKLLIWILAIAAVVLVVIQLVPVPARANPPVESRIQWNSAQTEQLVRTACYDCHSNETTWPWYAYVAPFSWLVAHDVEEGRAALNFSVARADQISGEEAAEEVQDGEMPPRVYLPLHPEASLSAEQKLALIAGLEASLTGTEEGESEENESRNPDAESASGEQGEAGEASE